MPCSAARWWKGIKQASLAQMTHDMVLRPGPLFMASHVSRGLLPWGAPQPLSANLAQPVLRANITPGRCTKGNTIHSRNSDQHNVEACTCDRVVRRNQIEFLIEKVFFSCHITIATLLERSKPTYMKCYFRGINVISG